MLSSHNQKTKTSFSCPFSQLSIIKTKSFNNISNIQTQNILNKNNTNYFFAVSY